MQMQGMRKVGEIWEPVPVVQPLPSRVDPQATACCICAFAIGILVLGILNIKDGKEGNGSGHIVFGSICVAAASCCFIGIANMAVRSYMKSNRPTPVGSDYTRHIDNV